MKIIFFLSKKNRKMKKIWEIQLNLDKLMKIQKIRKNQEKSIGSKSRKLKKIK